MASELPRSMCPHCGAKGVRMADSRYLDGVLFEFPYCGACGKNWPRPKPAVDESEARNVLRMPESSR